ncbi:MAG: SO2930 family diheme c-type cytochrome [Pseudohongiella sp.]|nr:SO2930 family diheme c-type cytochrome [Pseudohongiella sp.]MDO9522037.1 SO2930 family diheme c-type cytochrome [Pseudohongiella sp.]
MNREVLLTAALLLSACSDSSGPQLFPADAAPAELSRWQLMQVSTGDNSLQLDPAVLAYDLATPLFSDYALKLRTVWLPDGKSASYTTLGSVDFPIGTIISKTFYYPRASAAPDDITAVQWTADALLGFDGQALDLSQVWLLETRLLVHQESGWQALPYVWNDEQTDASLQIAGDIKRLSLHRKDLAEEFAYVVPNRNECASCHQLDQNNKGLSPIGPSARNLNRLISFYPDGPANQLEVWQARQWLEGLPAREQRPMAALWSHDQPLTPEHALEQRARDYLAVNCAHCHQRGGSGDTSGLFLNTAETDATRLGLCKPPVAAGRGTGGHRFSIEPGKPEQSILSYRIFSNEVGVLMPEVGRSLIHQEGLELVNAWIRHMPGDCN